MCSLKIIHFSDPFDTSHLDAIIDKEEAEGMYLTTNKTTN